MKPPAPAIAREIQLLHEAAAEIGPVNFMEVCGTHTMSAFRCGLPSILPPNVALLSGPGCPVCVTSQGDIDQMIELAYRRHVTVCTYGDMLRVPGRRGSLQTARSRGADVRVVYSATDVLRFAAEQSRQQFVFIAVGFETTAPATAATVRLAAQHGLKNLSFFVSHKRVMPALEALLARGQTQLHGLLCPGHVSVIIGAEAYRPLVDRYHLPCVIAGFEERLMITALAQLTRQVRSATATLVNQYPEAVTDNGNPTALKLLDEVLQPTSANWRGFGEIAESGLCLRHEYRDFDAGRRFGLEQIDGQVHAKCICGQVVTATAVPRDCELFGKECTPTRPLGPCMVSSEGTCQAWFKYRRHPGLRVDVGRLTACAREQEAET